MSGTSMSPSIITPVSVTTVSMESVSEIMTLPPASTLPPKMVMRPPSVMLKPPRAALPEKGRTSPALLPLNTLQSGRSADHIIGSFIHDCRATASQMVRKT